MDNLPQWARLYLAVGLPSFLVLIGLLVAIGRIDSPLTTLPMIQRDLAAHVQHTAVEGQEVTRLMRQICRNVSKSEISAAACEAR